MESPDPDDPKIAPETPPSLSVIADARQRDYARSRREWAEAVGRPYERRSDPRPPPGEVDGVADE